MVNLIADFLAGVRSDNQGGTRCNVLDIGSGIGKFCLAAAYHRPDAVFYGVEQHAPLVEVAEKIRNKFAIRNARFIKSNFTQIDFGLFDHFYYFNSCFENLANAHRLGGKFNYSEDHYQFYVRYLRHQLETKPAGTRLCTLETWGDEIPDEYKMVDCRLSDILKFWIKI